MIGRLVKPLDRYVFAAFLRIFVVTALGFPLLVIIIDATDNLGAYLAKDIPAAKVALSYLYYAPESLFMVLPASVLFATVFTIGSLARHSELTAAKASGISFYRIIAPLAVGSMLAMAIVLVVGETVPVATARRNAILGTKASSGGDARYGFAFSAEDGRVYTIGRLDTKPPGSISQLQIERGGTGRNNPTVVTMATQGVWTMGGWWKLTEGEVHVIAPDSEVLLSVHFVGLRDFHFKERPTDLLERPAAPDEMRRTELARYIRGMERSGVDVNPLRVDRMLRIAIPATCLIIFLFGAPLAASSPRGGAAFGVGIALATTVTFLMLVQLTKAVGSHGLLTPELAAWLPSMVFGIAGVVLLARART